MTVVVNDAPVSPVVGPLCANDGEIKVVNETVELLVVVPAPVASTQK